MLSKLQQLKEEREQGFTLIELLVVILIIGILAAIAIPAFLNQRKSAVDSSAQADLNTIAKEISTLDIKNGGQVGTVVLTQVAGSQSVKVDVGTATNTITLSKGNTFAVDATKKDTNGYIIKATNPGGDIAAKTTGFTYDSANGGLKGS